MNTHPALKSEQYLKALRLMILNKPFELTNQHGEHKAFEPGSPIYNLQDLQFMFKFCYAHGESLSVRELPKVAPKVLPIDKALYELEKVADARGLHLEDVEGYVPLCEFLADLDVYGCSDKGFYKADCIKVLKACIVHVFPNLADNPMWWFQHKIVEVYYNG